MRAITPLSRRTLHDDLVERIRDMIIEGQLAPLSPDPRGPARQGARRVANAAARGAQVPRQRGPLELVPGRGAIVRKLTPKDVRDMLDVLAASRRWAGASPAATPPMRRSPRLRRMHDDMMALYHARQPPRVLPAQPVDPFGDREASGNALLASMHQVIQARLKRIRFIGNEEPDKWAAAVQSTRR